jgi:hypothetical protein
MIWRIKDPSDRHCGERGKPAYRCVLGIERNQPPRKPAQQQDNHKD